jgi:hypothetical protein
LRKVGAAMNLEIFNKLENDIWNGHGFVKNNIHPIGAEGK